ncbi:MULTISPECIES: response regulator [unclassified Lentimicrobium]|uniref:response regulator n=1 Tax=unclassified Lentimicrobium TaxID=2677434 RepID=UPI001554467A|nr:MULTISPECIES: response regulator [unclassified Lentimicrobium]NPD44769.1 response regulator [Lentimicrobium sp. S6]NPD83375.1 response regulator [Lentimicrobium sp. L6]
MENQRETYDWSDKTVLIAEDVDDNFLFLKTFLRKTKINVLWAKDGKEAIEFCQKDDNIDIVLMDIRMPFIDGYEATRKIKEFKPDLPIIAQTAYALNSDYQKVFDAGCDEYITKPILGKILFQKMEKFIKK